MAGFQIIIISPNMARFISRTAFLLFLVLLAFKPQMGQAQVDSTFRFYFYDQRYSLFQVLPDTPGEIIMLGNSITNGANWSELFNNPNIRNRGISGDNTFGILHRLEEVTASRPEKIFLLIGINDISKETPVEVILNNYRRIVERIREDSPDTRLYLQSIMPTSNEFDHFPRAYNREKEIEAVNQGIEMLAARYGATFIDLHPHFLDEHGKLNKEFTNDGLHLMGEGYLHWARILRPYIEEKTENMETAPVSTGDLYYQRKRAMHEAMQLTPDAVVMLGNSLTEGGLWHELLPGVAVVNRGIGGDHLQGMLDRLPGIVEHKPKAIFIMAGINNILFYDASPASVAGGVEAMIQLIKEKSPSTKIYLQNILPVNEIAGENRDFLLNRHSTIITTNKL
ncbi:MAG: hypothetical protein EA361_06455, partial [Bacteroidetes bacterium]